MIDAEWNASLWRRKIIKMGGMLGLIVTLSTILSLFSIWNLKQIDNQRDITLRGVLDEKKAVVEGYVSFRQSIQDWKNVLIRGQNPQDRVALVEAFKRDTQKSIDKLGEAIETNIKNAQQDSQSYPMAVNDEKQAADIRAQIVNNSHFYLTQLPSSEQRLLVSRVDDNVKGMDRPISEKFDNLIADLDYGFRIRIVFYQYKLQVRFVWLRTLVWSALAITVVAIGLIVAYFNRQPSDL